MMQNKKYLTLKFIDDILTFTFHAFDTPYIYQLRFQFSTCFLNRNSTLIHGLSQTCFTLKYKFLVRNLPPDFGVRNLSNTGTIY